MAAASSSSASFFGIREEQEQESNLIQLPMPSMKPTSSSAAASGSQQPASSTATPKKRRNQPGNPSKYLNSNSVLACFRSLMTSFYFYLLRTVPYSPICNCMWHIPIHSCLLLFRSQNPNSHRISIPIWYFCSIHYRNWCRSGRGGDCAISEDSPGDKQVRVRGL